MTVLLLAPIGLDHRFWDRLEIGTADVVCHEFPGFGGRQRAPMRATMDDWVDEVASVIEASGMAPVDIVGCSLGAMVGQNLTIVQPALVRSLLLACTGSDADPDVMQERAVQVESRGMAGVVDETMDRWFTAEALAQRPAHPGVEYARTTLLGLDPGAFADGWRVIGGHNATDDLDGIGVPTTCVAAREDQAARMERVASLSKGIAGSRLVTTAGSHMAPIEDGTAFSRIVSEHLAWANAFPRPECGAIGFGR